MKTVQLSKAVLVEVGSQGTGELSHMEGGREGEGEREG